ncbi:MAG: hypothetical protein EOP83_00535 [Verrucomicrobiaceae bacterium]|nr:MAG: hypothetical protein EOP83_00535 [Verrucomicrobiaceae bacterium]
MDKDHRWIVNSLTFILVPAAIAAFVRAANKPARVSEGVKWLEYGLAMKAFSILSGIIPVMITISLVFSEPEDPVGAIVCLVLFGGLTLSLLLESFLVRIGFDEEWIYTRSAWRKERKIPWSETGSPSYADTLRWWRIPTRSQGVIRLHDFISGKDSFFEMLERQEQGVPR